MDGLTLLQQDERKDLLRFITAGSVDDGKSTLIGRLLVEAKGIYEDQLASVKKASARRGSAQGEVDFSLFTDGLKAEREQNITIDVAYRYFSTPRRKFIIADTPGHEQYTRNMVTGASTASLMVILIDAAQGMLDQSRRHAFIASLLGIQHIVVAVNKMDLVDYSQDVFEAIRKDFTEFAAKLQPHDVIFMPVSALLGDNVVHRSANTPWYQGSTLLNHLETVHVASDRNLIDLRFPVQYVCRPDAVFRGYMGAVASGVIRPGDDIVVLPSGATTKVRSVLGPDGEIAQAFAPMSCCVVLEDELDVNRGCMLVHPHNRPAWGGEFEAMVVWMAAEPLQVGQPYQIKHTTRSMLGEVSAIRYSLDVSTLHHRDAAALKMNEVGRAVMRLSQPIAYDPYSLNRGTGSFIMIDRVTNNTVGAGTILPRDPKEAVPVVESASSPGAQAAPQAARNTGILLTTERLILRDFVEDDWRAVHEYDTDPEVVRYMPWGPNTEQQTKEFIAGAIRQQEEMPRRQYELAVVLRDTNRLIGACGLRLSRPDHHGGDIGYSFNRQFWGQGYATEAARAIIRFGFEQCGLHRIFATCDAQNVASGRVLEKLGMRREGHFLQDKWERQQWRDSLLFAILADEWKAGGA
jgi:sulfate adenylyltransferase large subunit